MKALFLAWMRQSSTILGIAVFVATTVALVTRQITVAEATAAYSGAITAMVIPQHPPAAVTVQQANSVQVEGNPAPPNTTHGEK